MKYPFVDNHLKTSITLLVFSFILVAIVIFIFTNVVYQISLGSGIWFFYVFFFLIFLFVGLTSIAKARLKPEFKWIKYLMYFLTISMLIVLIALGIIYRPFNPGNLELKLGVVPVFDLNGTGAAPTEDVAKDLEGVVPNDIVNYEDILPAAINQGNCNSCWAVAAAQLMSARIMMQKRKEDPKYEPEPETTCALGTTNVARWFASPQWIIDADDQQYSTNFGKCNTGLSLAAFQIGQRNGGIPDMSCVPYTAGRSPNCNCNSHVGISFGKTICGYGDKFVARSCTDRTSIASKVIVNSFYEVNGEEQMEQELTKNGPIMSVINLYTKKDGSRANWTLSERNSLWGQYSRYISKNYVCRPLYDGDEYTKGPIIPIPGAFSEYHIITIYGYGEVGGIKYWNCRNTWGAGWGVGGNIKIERGIDAWNIESNCIGAKVSLQE